MTVVWVGVEIDVDSGLLALAVLLWQCVEADVDRRWLLTSLTIARLYHNVGILLERLRECVCVRRGRRRRAVGVGCAVVWVGICIPLRVPREAIGVGMERGCAWAPMQRYVCVSIGVEGECVQMAGVGCACVLVVEWWMVGLLLA